MSHPTLIGRAGTASTSELEFSRFSSTAWRRTLEQVECLAPCDSIPIVLHGPPGSGKTKLARYIHSRSARSVGPFEMLDLGATEESLAGSELFGHERGAFTGASASHKGRLVLADRGTLFLDELAKASRAIQQKLLGIIEGNPFRPLGTTRDVRVDVRLVVAFNEDLSAMVDRGEFLRDLYERLRSFFIEVPALSERRIDIPDLATRMVARRAAEMHRDPPVISQDLMRVLICAPWPGNLRQLDNSLLRMMATARGAECLDVEHLAVSPDLAALAARRSLADHTTEELEALISESNVSAVARKLGVDRKTLYRRLSRSA